MAQAPLAQAPLVQAPLAQAPLTISSGPYGLGPFGQAPLTPSPKVTIVLIPCYIFRPTDPGCLQYHTGTTGRIETFNFQANSQHLISQK